MTADVAETCSAEQRIADGMEQDIGVGVAEQTFFMGDLDAAHHELSAFNQAVDIVTVAYSHGHFLFRISSARIRSSGVVILIFS